ncbi:MAG TPA: cbb3-type cytochrome c oxidase subunit 3 [Gammaproteobacteria bacterium]
MSGLSGHLVGVLILVLMTTFIGIWVWAWRPRHRPVFDALAQLPMLDNRPADAGEHGEAAERDGSAEAGPGVPGPGTREGGRRGRPS